MLRLGEVQELVIVKRVAFGVYLSEDRESEERVLLPGKEPSYARRPAALCGSSIR